MAVADVIKQIKKHNVKFVDFRFTDTKGKEQHVSVPVSAFGKEKFTAIDINKDGKLCQAEKAAMKNALAERKSKDTRSGK